LRVKPLFRLAFIGFKHVEKLTKRKMLWQSGKKCYFVLNELYSSKPLIMTGFLGEFEATLDTKGRFLLPAGLKKQLPEGENTRFVINRGFEKCLSLYPLQSWEPLFARISSLDDFDPDVRKFRRFFLNGAIEVELDSAGRLLMPPNLKEYAELSKDIVLASAVDKIEIWSTENYNKFFESYSPSDFSSLAQQVMVKKTEKEQGS
jgi:MraZ protein